jgi:hypothetical protein
MYSSLHGSYTFRHRNIWFNEQIVHFSRKYIPLVYLLDFDELLQARSARLFILMWKTQTLVLGGVDTGGTRIGQEQPLGGLYLFDKASEDDPGAAFLAAEVPLLVLMLTQARVTVVTTGADFRIAVNAKFMGGLLAVFTNPLVKSHLIFPTLLARAGGERGTILLQGGLLEDAIGRFGAL